MISVITFACEECGTIHTGGEARIPSHFTLPEDNMVCRHIPDLAKDCIHRQLEKAYGECGQYAAESMCLTQADYMIGFEHCVEKIAPALEEELMCLGGDKPKDFEE